MNTLFSGLLSTSAARLAAGKLLRKRGRPLYLSVCVHTEKVHDSGAFESMLRLGRSLDFRPSACVMTPANPFIAAEMERLGVSGDVFRSRLKELSGLFEIGYHGHWCRRSAAGPAPAAKTEIERAGFSLTLGDAGAVAGQFRAECSWLTQNLYSPRTYSAGWWHMDRTVAGLLQEAGFNADCSLRHGHADTFGGRYLEPAGMPPKGRPFVLPGTTGVLELPSVFYLHLNWWTVLKDLLPLLAAPGGPLFAVLPTHDYNLAGDGGRTLDNLRLLAGLPNVKFLSLSAMREAGEKEAWRAR